MLIHPTVSVRGRTRMTKRGRDEKEADPQNGPGDVIGAGAGAGAFRVPNASNPPISTKQ